MKDFLYAYSDAIDESYEKGVEKGVEKGRADREKERVEAIKSLLVQKVAPDVIAKAYGIPVETVLSLKEK